MADGTIQNIGAKKEFLRAVDSVIDTVVEEG